MPANKFAVLLVCCVVLAACGEARDKPTDAGVVPGVDAGVVPGVDAGGVDADADAGESAVLEIDGVWIATDKPTALLRFEAGKATPSNTLRLEHSPSYVEIVDEVAFYLGGDLNGWSLYFYELKTGNSGEIIVSAESEMEGMVFADGSLWVGDRALDRVWRINPKTKEVVGGTALGFGDRRAYTFQLASDGTSVYVSGSSNDEVVRFSIASGQVEARSGRFKRSTGIAVGEGSAWATSQYDGPLWRLHPDTFSIEKKIPLEANLHTVRRNAMVAGGSVWVLVGDGQEDFIGFWHPPSIVRVDPISNMPVALIPLRYPVGLQVHGDELWATTRTEAVQIDMETNEVARTLVVPAGKVVDVAFPRTGGGTGSTAGLPKFDISSVVRVSPMLCEDLDGDLDVKNPPPPLYGNGTATLTDSDGSHVLANGTCITYRTQHDENSYVAYFATTEEPISYVYFRESSYMGDGTYRPLLSADTAWAGYRVDPVSAVISQGGRHGVVAGADIQFEFDCVPDADLGSDGEPTPNPERGEAVVQTSDGRALRFGNVLCGYSEASPYLDVYDSRLYGILAPRFSLESRGYAEAGTLQAILSATDNGVEVVARQDVQVTFECGEPSHGTFKGAGGLEGSFTCY